MKKLTTVVLTLMLVSTGAFAAINKKGSVNDLRSQGLKVNMPTIEASGTLTGVDKFCIDGDTLRSNLTTQKCTSWNLSKKGDRISCAKFKTVAVVASMSALKNVCLKTEQRGDNTVCTMRSQTNTTRNLNYKVNVVKPSEKNEKLLFSINHTIKKCKS